MPNINFPSSPQVNDSYTFNGSTWVWNGYAWILLNLVLGGTGGYGGAEGTSGKFGASGTSGTSGMEGTSGTSGINGSSGTSGTSGRDGRDGTGGGSFDPTAPETITAHWTFNGSLDFDNGMVGSDSGTIIANGYSSSYNDIYGNTLNSIFNSYSLCFNNPIGGYGGFTIGFDPYNGGYVNSPFWSIDVYGNFSGSVGYATNANNTYSLGNTWYDDGNNLNSSGYARGISTVYWNIDQYGRVDFDWGAITSDGSGNVTLNSITAPNWNIDQLGNFSGTANSANSANYASYCGQGDGSDGYGGELATQGWCYAMGIGSGGGGGGYTPSFDDYGSGTISDGCSYLLGSLSPYGFPNGTYFGSAWAWGYGDYTKGYIYIDNYGTLHGGQDPSAPNWSIDYQGNFSGYTNNANNAYYASYLGNTWYDDGNNLNSSGYARGISTPNWNIDQIGRVTFDWGAFTSDGSANVTANSYTAVDGAMASQAWVLNNSAFVPVTIAYGYKLGYDYWTIGTCDGDEGEGNGIFNGNWSISWVGVGNFASLNNDGSEVTYSISRNNLGEVFFDKGAFTSDGSGNVTSSSSLINNSLTVGDSSSYTDWHLYVDNSWLKYGSDHISGLLGTGAVCTQIGAGEIHLIDNADGGAIHMGANGYGFNDGFIKNGAETWALWGDGSAKFGNGGFLVGPSGSIFLINNVGFTLTQLNSDGSGYFAETYFSWDTAGNLTANSLQSAEGGAAFSINADGSCRFDHNKVGSDGSGNVTLHNLTSATIGALNFANDTAAAAGGVPIGGIYNTAGVLKIRLT